jgi:hypothetical protein
MGTRLKVLVLRELGGLHCTGHLTQWAAHPHAVNIKSSAGPAEGVIPGCPRQHLNRRAVHLGHHHPSPERVAGNAGRQNPSQKNCPASALHVRCTVTLAPSRWEESGCCPAPTLSLSFMYVLRSLLQRNFTGQGLLAKNIQTYSNQAHDHGMALWPDTDPGIASGPGTDWAVDPPTNRCEAMEGHMEGCAGLCTIGA